MGGTTQPPPYYLARPGSPSQPDPQSTGDPFIDGLIAQGYTWSRGADGSLILFKPGDRFNDPVTQRFPNYFGDGSGPGSSRLASDDPRYWDLQYAQLDQDERQFAATLQQRYEQMGMDKDTARQRALTDLIQSRNNLAGDVANTSANVAKTAAEFAANPRDAFAELFYRNQVGGTVPFGDMTNDHFGEYGKALAEKAASIFTPVNQDLQQARLYRDAIPLPEYLSGTQQAQVAPAPAQAVAGDPLTALTDRLKSLAPQQQEDFRMWTDPQYREAKQATVEQLPKFDMGGVVKSRTGIGDSPTSTEGGLNLNLFEPAMVVGMDSGKVYATVAEPRPDGTRRGEQLIVKPLKSEAEKDKKLAEGEKAVTQSFGVPKMAGGGNVNATPDDLMQQLSQYLGSFGGAGGGTGPYKTPLPSLRLLAGAPWNQLEDDPVAMDYALAGYSAQGIDPRTVQATLKKFSPASAQRVGQTNARTSFL